MVQAVGSMHACMHTSCCMRPVHAAGAQVCPAGWKPGDVTMKPTPKDSKEYFAAL